MEILFSKRSVKALAHMDSKLKNRIKNAIENIPSGDIRPLVGTDNVFRLRVGEYRVLFSYIGKEGTVLIEKIAPRGEIYKEV